MMSKAQRTGNAETSPTKDKSDEEPEIQMDNSQELNAHLHKSAATSEDQDVPDNQATEFVKRGSNLTKVRSLTHTYRRYFYVDSDAGTLRYKGSRKGQRCASSLSHQRDQKNVSLHEITEVRGDARPGSILNRFRAVASRGRSRPSSAFTVIIGEAGDTLDLVANNATEKDTWVRGLNCLVQKSRDANFYEQQMSWLNDKFQEVDKNKDGFLQLDEALAFMQSINVCPKVTDRLFSWCGGGSKGICKSEFIELYKKLSEREEITEIFKNLSHKSKFIGPTELVQFFKVHQNETLDADEAKKLITDNEPCTVLNKQGRFSCAGFLAMFSSVRLNIKKPITRQVYHDMTQPLSHYFINSSHNTYLEGNQIGGVSSVEQYSRVLKHRCRCVEIDVWNGTGSSDGEPIVYHGYTFTTKIAFRDVLAGIKEYAFKKSQYPLILSLENHCSINQQKVMAKLLHETFGEQLLTELLLQNSDKLPSPEELKNKIILKGKKLPEVSSTIDDSASEEDEAAGIEDEDVQRQVKKRSESERKHELATELSDCVVICRATKFKDFKTSATKHTALNMSSFVEDKALKFSTSRGERVEFLKHNRRQLSRIYPAGSRIDSSNYNPVPMWNAGCQVVALNFQTRDDRMLLNYGRFEDNGSCGYVLKPEFMRDPNSTFDPDGPFPAEQSRTLKVRVISGYLLPKKAADRTSNILDPCVKVISNSKALRESELFGCMTFSTSAYVTIMDDSFEKHLKVEVHGVAKDCVQRTTNFIENNGFNPVWNETLPPIVLHCPDLAIIVFKVCDKTSSEDKAMVAQYSLPFNCIQTGYRMIALRDVTGNIIGPTSLFVHISITRP